MTARVFIHPRCFDGPAQCALESALIERGFDLTSMCVGPPTKGCHRELVTLIERNETTMTLERMDGSRFVHVIRAALELA